MVKIRLARRGSKNNPFYHIVVTDSRNSRDGKFIEHVGFFNPIIKSNEKNKGIYINLSRLRYWIEKGAQPSMRVVTLIKNNKEGLDKKYF